jgi:hypothetical protein
MFLLVFSRLIAAGAALAPAILLGQSQTGALQSLTPLSSSLDLSASVSFPEKVIVGRSGNAYLLDTELSTIFVTGKSGGDLSKPCELRAVGSASDVSVDAGGSIWILDSFKSRIIRLNQQCRLEKSFPCRNTPQRLQVNTFGEVVVLTAEGENLFDVYSAEGKLLRSFGRRFRYGNPIADGELSDGRLCADKWGGIYFSFNYPPLIRHYGRDGRLISEFQPEADVSIRPPEVSSRTQGNQLAVSAQYQILILDMAADRNGRLYFLISGQNKVVALTRGSRNLRVSTSTGRTLKKISLDDSFHRLAVHEDVLYLLRSRRGPRLVRYALPYSPHRRS